MAIDISNLPVTPEDIELDVDYDNYVEAGEFPSPIADGTYNFKPLEVQFDFIEAKNGDPAILKAVLKHEAFDEQGNAIGKVSFDRISDKPFLRGKDKVKASHMADQFIAWGDRQRYGNKQEKALAIKAHVDAGDPFRAVTKREVFCNHKDTPQAVAQSKDGWTLKGNKIPAGEDEMTCPVCQKKARINARIDRRIPKS